MGLLASGGVVGGLGLVGGYMSVAAGERAGEEVRPSPRLSYCMVGGSAQPEPFCGSGHGGGAGLGFGMGDGGHWRCGEASSVPLGESNSSMTPGWWRESSHAASRIADHASRWVGTR